MTLNPRVKQFCQASASIVVLLAAWQIASFFFPHYLFPPVQDVLARTVQILFNWPELLQVLENARQTKGADSIIVDYERGKAVEYIDLQSAIDAIQERIDSGEDLDEPIIVDDGQ